MNDRIDGDTSAKKGRRTQRRAVALTERRTRGAALSSWLQDRLGLAQKRAAVARLAKPTGGGHGVTLVMKAISRESAQRDPVWVVQHSTPNRAMRRSRRGA